jgi:hypothetical protein
VSLPVLAVTLSEAQRLEALKRLRKIYGDELAKVEAELTDILTAVAEAEYLVQYVGDQPEVKALRGRGSETERLEQRRQYLGKLIERLDAVTPQQKEVKAPLPNAVGGSASGARPVGQRRY